MRSWYSTRFHREQSRSMSLKVVVVVVAVLVVVVGTHSKMVKFELVVLKQRGRI